jgi:hypothetical protein
MKLLAIGTPGRTAIRENLLTMSSAISSSVRSGWDLPMSSSTVIGSLGRHIEKLMIAA